MTIIVSNSAQQGAAVWAENQTKLLYHMKLKVNFSRRNLIFRTTLPGALICTWILLLIDWPTHASDFPIYADSLQHGWYLNTATGPADLNNTAPVFSGSYSIAVPIPAGYSQNGIVLSTWPGFDATGYGQVQFEINGGTAGLYWITVAVAYSQYSYWYYTIGLGPVDANTWRTATISFPSPALQDPTTFTGVEIFAGFNNGATLSYPAVFYIDDVRFTSVPEPTIISFLLLGLLEWCASSRPDLKRGQSGMVLR
jgi:hypothetical protein